MGNDYTTAAALFAGAQGSVAVSFTIFATVYSLLFSPIQGAMSGTSSGLAATTVIWVKYGVVAALMLWGCVRVLRSGETNLFGEMISRVLAPAAVVAYVLSAQYQTIVQALMSQINTWSNAMVAGVGGTAPTGGAPFDTLMNHAYAAGVAAYDALPITPSTLGQWLFITLIYFPLVAISLWFAFALFVIAQYLIYLLFAIGPIFVGFGAFQWSRFLFKGFVSAVASAMCTQVIIMALLAIAFQLETSVLNPIWQTGGGGQAANSNTWGTGLSLIGVAGSLVVMTYSAFKASAWAVGICGGIFDGVAPYVLGGMIAARGFAGGIRNAGSIATGGRSAVRPAVVPAGRSMSAP